MRTIEIILKDTESQNFVSYYTDIELVIEKELMFPGYLKGNLKSLNNDLNNSNIEKYEIPQEFLIK